MHDLINSKLFYNPNGIHGINHAKRVLKLAERIAELQRLPEYGTTILQYSASLHDIGRINDFEDETHGELSMVKVNEYNLLEGLDYQSRIIIENIIKWHCIPDEIGISNIIQSGIENKETAINLYKLFKDADGLDRIRLGDLDLDYLRFKSSKTLQPYAQELLLKSSIFYLTDISNAMAAIKIGYLFPDLIYLFPDMIKLYDYKQISDMRLDEGWVIIELNLLDYNLYSVDDEYIARTEHIPINFINGFYNNLLQPISIEQIQQHNENLFNQMKPIYREIIQNKEYNIADTSFILDRQCKALPKGKYTLWHATSEAGLKHILDSGYIESINRRVYFGVTPAQTFTFGNTGGILTPSNYDNIPDIFFLLEVDLSDYQIYEEPEVLNSHEINYFIEGRVNARDIISAYKCKHHNIIEKVNL